MKVRASRAAAVAGVCCLSGMGLNLVSTNGAHAQAASASDPPPIEEVIVTAQRRSQNLQDVGVAVNAFSGSQIEHMQIESPHDLMFGVPGLVVSYSQGSNIPNFALRGVGLYDFAPNNSSPVAVQLDDVYQSYSAFLNFGLYDVGRVEVLKGPQGTLFGRNTTAGVVNIFTNPPTQEFAAAARLSYGNYDAVKGDFFVNGPVSDDVSARLSGFFKTQDSGPWYNTFYHRHVGKVPELWGGRLQLAYNPNDSLTVNLNIHGGKERSESAQYNMLPALNRAGTGPCAEYSAGTLKGGEADCFDYLGNQKPDTNPFSNAAGLINTQRLESYGATLHADLDLGFATLTSVTGYDHLYRYAAEDADGFPQIIVDDLYENRIRQYSQELRLTSPQRTRLHWVVGALFSHDEINTPRQEFLGADFAPSPGDLNASYVQKTTAGAVFGHVEWAATDEISLIGGLRYTHEKRSFDGQTVAELASPTVGAPGIPFNPPIVLASNDSSRTFTDLSWTSGVNYKPSRDLLLYVSASKGFKSGGYNGNLAFSDAELEPFGKETLIAYEAGVKATLLDGRLLWDTSAFHYDYKHIILQVGITSQLPNGASFTVFRLTNGADARMNGLESNLTWRPLTGMDVQAGLSYLDSHLTNAPPGNEAINASVPAYSPKWSGNISVRYERPLSASYVGSLQTDAAYKGDFFERVPNTKLVAQDAYWIVNARAEIGPASKTWSVALWAQNLTNTTYIQYVNDIEALGYVLKTAGYPRTYGIEVAYKW